MQLIYSFILPPLFFSALSLGVAFLLYAFLSPLPFHIPLPPQQTTRPSFRAWDGKTSERSTKKAGRNGNGGSTLPATTTTPKKDTEKDADADDKHLRKRRTKMTQQEPRLQSPTGQEPTPSTVVQKPFRLILHLPRRPRRKKKTSTTWTTKNSRSFCQRTKTAEAKKGRKANMKKKTNETSLLPLISTISRATKKIRRRRRNEGHPRGDERILRQESNNNDISNSNLDLRRKSTTTRRSPSTKRKAIIDDDHRARRKMKIDFTPIRSETERVLTRRETETIDVRRRKSSNTD